MPKTLTQRLAAGAAALALLTGGTVAMAAPASAAPTLTRSTYHLNCNLLGWGCHKALHIHKGYSYYDVCSDYDCTKFRSYAAHPSPSKIGSTWRVIRHAWS